MSGMFLVSYIALWILVVTMAVLLILLYRHFGMMSLGTLEGVQRDGLPVGSVAPAVTGITSEGVDHAWQPSIGKPQVLLFAAPDCEPCATVMPSVNKFSRDAAGLVEVAVVTPGPREEAVLMDQKYHSPFLTLAEDGSGAFNRFRVRVTPFGFVIGADGRVLAKGLCGDPSRLRHLLHAAGMKEAALLVDAPGRGPVSPPKSPGVTLRNGTTRA